MKTKKHINALTSNPLPWVIGVLLIFGLAVAGGVYWHRTNKITHIQIIGLHYVNKKTIKKHLDVPIGMEADSLNYKAISRQIKEIPYVESVRFHLSPGGTLTLNITERTPIALLINGSKRVYVDKTGTRLEKKPGQTVNVPIVHGFFVTSKQDTAQTKAFRQTMRFLYELHQNKAADATISEVVWNGKKGVIALTNDNGVKVIFGKEDFAKRLRNYDALFRSVVRKEGIGRFHSIDLRFEGQIVTHED